MNQPIITLLTDFGLEGSYVASMKGVALGICPHARLVDISHLIPPQDVRSAAFVLSQVYRDFPVGAIHVAVVDPGVGTSRQALAVEAGAYFFVGPDNGLFSWVLSREESWRARSLENSRYWRYPVSKTFHGRDIFAPVAAHLANGTSMDDLGPERVPLTAPWSHPVEHEGGLLGEVVFVDHFGNAVTNLETEHLERFPSVHSLTIDVGNHSIRGLTETYGAVSPGTVIALLGSCGYLEIAVTRGNASGVLGIGSGSPVRVHA